MKISTHTYPIAHHIGEEKAVESIAKAGFDAWDFSLFVMRRYDYAKKQPIYVDHPLAGDNYLQYVRKLKQIGLDNGIVCNQSHAPFPTACKDIRSLFKRSIECTAEAGGEICVIHPDNNKSPEENSEIYQELLPFAKEHNVKIATENMWNWDWEKNEASFAACATPESFNAHLDAVGDDFLVACLDIGHAEMKGLGTSAVEMIKALGNRLKALHIHDNDLWHDSHQIPFTMNIDFIPIVKALKEINYNGYFTMECDALMNDYTKENIQEGIEILAKTAKRLAKMY